MKTVALEEHFVTQAFLDATNTYGSDAPAGLQAVRGKLLDLGPGRLAAMDAGGVDVQVLSLAAMGIDHLHAADQTAIVRSVHDELAAAIAAHPHRFAGFCSPGLKDTASATKEMERCLALPGFRGVLVDGTVDGRFLDDARFLPFWEAAAALNVPVYLHPAPPPEPVRAAYYEGLPGAAGHLLSIAGWGWHAENGLHLLRLIVSGLFDRFPNLRLLVGHMGEGVPYALARSSKVLEAATKHLGRSVAETIRQQVWFTTSGYFTRPPFDCCRAVVGLDRMMYSVDYPFSPNEIGQRFLDSLDLTGPEKAAFTHGTAESLLGPLP